MVTVMVFFLGVVFFALLSGMATAFHTEHYCRECHGNNEEVADRHHFSRRALQDRDCTYCHEVEPPPDYGISIERDCMASGCHDTYDQGWHQNTNVAGLCNNCHDPNIFCVISVIREKLNGKQQLIIFNAPQGLQDDIEPPIASDLTFGSSASEQKNIAMAGVDIDGNGIDEIAVIREKLNGKQQLIIFNAPQGVDGETGASMASDLTFGNYNYRNNIALAGVDINGDGIDEIAVVKERPDGRQRLFIYNAPKSLEDEIEPAIATNMRFGDRYTGRNIIGMTGIDINGDGFDEIAVIKQKTNGRQRLEIYNAPQGLGINGGTGPPIASDLTFGRTTNNWNNIAMAGVDINGDGIDEIAVIKQKINGRQRLEIYHAPKTVAGETGAPIASDRSFGIAGTDRNTIFVSGMKF